MTTEAEFIRAVAAARKRIGARELLPSAMSLAARDLLFADGVSISVAESEADAEFRVPLGASDDAALIAENLQFTAGDGPCLTAIRSGTLINAPLDRMRRHWPVLADLLITRTDFRSSLSYPLVSGPQGGAALNLFFTSGDGGLDTDLEDVAAVAAMVSTPLFGEGTPSMRLLGPARRQNYVGVASREDVWIAVGMVISAANISFVDALARLRSYAFSIDRTVDELAGELIREPQRLDDLGP